MGRVPDSEPFCGITEDLAKEVCAILSCTVQSNST